MTHAEFSKGWKLLILQPWGWRYRSLTPEGKPSEESKTQMQFYYNKLSWAHPEAWWKVSDMFAQGEEWPSVSVLRTALQQVNAQFVKQIDTQEAEVTECPPEVRERLARIGVKVGT